MHLPALSDGFSALAILAVVSWAPACDTGSSGPSAPPPGVLGAHCTANAPCEDGLLCQEGDAVQLGWLNADCSTDADCDPGLRCGEDLCTTRDGVPGKSNLEESCTEDSDCISGLICQNDSYCWGDPDSASYVLPSTCQPEDAVGTAVLGASCRKDSDCMAGICLTSEYGPPFCTRPCESPQETCEDGPDGADGTTLCISFETLPDSNAPPFTGDLKTFCVPRCSLDEKECHENNANWEVCKAPTYLGDPLYPSLGTNVKICQAPSFFGKDPVDPSICDYEKTIDTYHNEANLCRNFCEYLQTCQVIAADASMRCCEWGCFNQMVVEDAVHDPWYDEVKCYWDVHNAYPPVGTANFCSQPPIECEEEPIDPTPPAAK